MAQISMKKGSVSVSCDESVTSFRELKVNRTELLRALRKISKKKKISVNQNTSSSLIKPLLKPRSVEEAMREFKMIKLNHYVAKGAKKKLKQIADKCSCVPAAKNKTKPGCGSNCLNRALNFECTAETCDFLRLNFGCSNQELTDARFPKRKIVSLGEKGLGMIADENISSGRLVEEYIGEIIDGKERVRRLNIVYKNETHKYLMQLSGDFLIDATREGSLARFINHSCDPNCQVQLWYCNGLPRLAIFAIKSIKKGEEVSFNYNFQRFGEADIPLCHCGAKTCKQIFGKRSLEDKRNHNGSKKIKFLEVRKDGKSLDPITLVPIFPDLTAFELTDLEDGFIHVLNKKNSFCSTDKTNQTYEHVSLNKNLKKGMSSLLKNKYVTEYLELLKEDVFSDY
eukprot:maker-scaffold_10-snap-gene-10.36-mRNA-1 protein AED:0.57 eAED:0.58 QI:0/0/0/1/1/1/3/0/397